MKPFIPLSISAMILFLFYLNKENLQSNDGFVSLTKSSNEDFISKNESPNFALSQETKIYDLRCEHVKDPLAVDVQQPLLRWKMESSINGIRPVTFEIHVASTLNKLLKGKPDLWESGKITRGDFNKALYRGKLLQPGRLYPYNPGHDV